MCNTYTFYHVCGHTYIRTLISCPLAVDRAVSAKLHPSSPCTPRTPRLIPLPLSAPISPLSLYTSSPSSLPRCILTKTVNATEDTTTTPHQPPTPSRPPLSLMSTLTPHPINPITPLTPSFRHLRTLYTCPTAPDAISIVPTPCSSCAALEAISASISGALEGRATFGVVDAWRMGTEREERRARARARSEVGRMGGLDTVGWEGVELLRPVCFGGEGGVSESGSEGSALGRRWGQRGRGSGNGSGSESGSESSRISSSALSGHSETSSRRKGIDAKTRIASARKRVVSGFGPGW